MNKQQEGVGQNQAHNSTAVIQGSILNNSVVIQAINNVHGPADLDRAIAQITKHLNTLRRKKGLVDVRLPLGLCAAACASAGLLLGGKMLWLLLGTLGSVAISYILSPALHQLDAEITAAQNLLTELYKLKIKKQLKDTSLKAA